MKKCPFCAEDIQNQATVCKYCKRSLASMPQPQMSAKTSAGINALAAHHAMDWKKALKIFGILLLVMLSFQFWYITIPGAAIWCLWKKAKFSRKTNIRATAALIITFAALEGMAAYAGRAPTLIISDPQNNYSIQARAVSIKGKVSPAKSSVLVNGNRISTDSSGNFNYLVQLPIEGGNQVAVVASNGGKQVSSGLTINRIFTYKEKAAQAKAEADAAAKAQADAAAQAKARADAAAAQAATDAKAKADKAAYEKTPTGKLCTKHSNWVKDECQGVADNKVWIGMTLDMLKAERGNPNIVNPSNYGSGTTWQWCWSDYTPSCFYGGSDGIITSYN